MTQGRGGEVYDIRKRWGGVGHKEEVGRCGTQGRGGEVCDTRKRWGGVGHKRWGGVGHKEEVGRCVTHLTCSNADTVTPTICSYARIPCKAILQRNSQHQL